MGRGLVEKSIRQLLWTFHRSRNLEIELEQLQNH